LQIVWGITSSTLEVNSYQKQRCFKPVMAKEFRVQGAVKLMCLTVCAGVSLVQFKSMTDKTNCAQTEQWQSKLNCFSLVQSVCLVGPASRHVGKHKETH
jgi:hypothetical protein